MEPLPGVPFDIAWRSVEARGVPFGEGYLSDNGSQPRFVRWGDGAIAVYSTPDEDGPGMMIWRSSDLDEWHQVGLPASAGARGGPLQLLVGGPGLVVLVAGADAEQRNTLLVSADGEHWQWAPSPPPIEFIWARPGVIVGYGEETWISRDGAAWSSAGRSPISGPDMWFPSVTIVEVGQAGVAFVSTGDEPTAVYGLWADGGWRHLSDLPGAVGHGGVGPSGIVALGGSLPDYAPTAWLSTDGITWQAAAGPSDPQTLLLTRAGYVATSQRIYMSGCDGLPLGEQIAQTWTSHDGLSWRQMPEQRLLDHTVISFLLDDPRAVQAVGVVWSGSFAGDGTPTFEPVTFEAALPQPEPSHTPLPVPVGCGEG